MSRHRPSRRSDLKLEAVVIPVADVGPLEGCSTRSLGWRLDADFAFDNGFRVVQFTPPGSPASVQFGTSITTGRSRARRRAFTWSSQTSRLRTYQLAALGVKVSEVFHPATPGAQFRPLEADGRVGGRASDHASYGSFCHIQRSRRQRLAPYRRSRRCLPGRIDAARVTSFASVEDLMNALTSCGRQLTASTRSGTAGSTTSSGPAWYAAYMVAEQSGAELPT